MCHLLSELPQPLVLLCVRCSYLSKGLLRSQPPWRHFLTSFIICNSGIFFLMHKTPRASCNIYQSLSEDLLKFSVQIRFWTGFIIILLLPCVPGEWFSENPVFLLQSAPFLFFFAFTENVWAEVLREGNFIQLWWQNAPDCFPAVQVLHPVHFQLLVGGRWCYEQVTSIITHVAVKPRVRWHDISRQYLPGRMY